MKNVEGWILVQDCSAFVQRKDQTRHFFLLNHYSSAKCLILVFPVCLATPTNTQMNRFNYVPLQAFYVFWKHNKYMWCLYWNEKTLSAFKRQFFSSPNTFKRNNKTGLNSVEKTPAQSFLWLWNVCNRSSVSASRVVTRRLLKSAKRDERSTKPGWSGYVWSLF